MLAETEKEIYRFGVKTLVLLFITQFHWIRICTNLSPDKSKESSWLNLMLLLLLLLLLFVIYFSSSVFRVGVFKDSLANFAAEDSVSRN